MSMSDAEQAENRILTLLHQISNKLDRMVDDGAYGFVKQRGDKIAQLEQRIEAIEQWVLGQIARPPKIDP